MASKSTRSSTFCAGTGRNSGCRAPRNVCPDRLQRPNERNVLVECEWRKATGPLVGVSCNTEIRAMDMPMTICVQIVLGVATPHCGTMVRPVVHAYGAANNVGTETELRSEPIRGDDSVGVRTGDPARARLDDSRCADCAGCPDQTSSRDLGRDASFKRNLRGAVATRIEYYDDQYLLFGKQWVRGSAEYCIEAGSQQDLFVAGWNYNSNHTRPSVRATERSSSDQTSSRKSSSSWWSRRFKRNCRASMSCTESPVWG